MHEFPLVSVSQLSVRVPPTSGKPLLEQIPRQNKVRFIDHAVTILLGNQRHQAQRIFLQVHKQALNLTYL